MKKVSELIKKPLLANMVERGKTPLLKNNELQDLGYSIAIYPVSPLYTVTKSIMEFLESLKRDKTSSTSLDRMVDFPTFNKMIHLDEIRDLEKKFTHN